MISYLNQVKGNARKILLWHFGKEGAGAKFTIEIGSALAQKPERYLNFVAAEDSELADGLSQVQSLSYHSISIFEGDKRSLSGLISAGLALLKLPRIAYDFEKIIDQAKPDIMMCSFQSIWDLAALPLLRRSKIPFVLVLHDAEPHPGDRYPMRAQALRWEVNAADGLIVLSDHVGRSARQLYNFPHSRIHKISHGRFDFCGTSVSARQFPDYRPFRLLFLGRIADYKGLPLLLSAYRDLQNLNQSLSLTIAGSGDLGASKALIESLPQTTLINTWLSDEDISNCLNEADAVVLPYTEASQSGVAAAAFSAGLPIIATPVGGLMEQIEHGVNGLISTAVSAQALANSILELSTSPDLYNRLSSNAVHHAKTSLDWSIIADDVGNILDQILALPRRNHFQKAITNHL